MTRKEIKKLAQDCYTDNKLDEKQIEKIGALLSRKDVKEFIRCLKQIEKKHNLYVALTDTNIYNQNKNLFKDLAKGKEIIFQENPSLLLGMQIINDDMIYEMSLQNRLESFQKDVENNYE